MRALTASALQALRKLAGELVHDSQKHGSENGRKVRASFPALMDGPNGKAQHFQRPRFIVPPIPGGQSLLAPQKWVPNSCNHHPWERGSAVLVAIPGMPPVAEPALSPIEILSSRSVGHPPVIATGDQRMMHRPLSWIAMVFGTPTYQGPNPTACRLRRGPRRLTCPRSRVGRSRAGGSDYDPRTD